LPMISTEGREDVGEFGGFTHPEHAGRVASLYWESIPECSRLVCASPHSAQTDFAAHKLYRKHG
jgi:hypothetical protein